MPSKKHSKVNRNNNNNCIFTAVHKAPGCEPEAKLMIVLHYEPNGKLTEARIEYSSWFTRKVMLLPGMLQCPVMSIC